MQCTFLFLQSPSAQSGVLPHRDGEGDEQKEYEGEGESWRLGTAGEGERVLRSGVEDREFGWTAGQAGEAGGV